MVENADFGESAALTMAERFARGDFDPPKAQRARACKKCGSSSLDRGGILHTEGCPTLDDNHDYGEMRE